MVLNRWRNIRPSCFCEEARAEGGGVSTAIQSQCRSGKLYDERPDNPAAANACSVA